MLRLLSLEPPPQHTAHHLILDRNTKYHVAITETTHDTTARLTWRAGGPCGRIIQVLPLPHNAMSSIAPCAVKFWRRVHLCVTLHEGKTLHFHGAEDGARYVTNLPFSVRRVFPMRDNGVLLHCEERLYMLLNPHAQPRLAQCAQHAAMPRFDEILHVEGSILPWIVAFDAQRAMHFVVEHNARTAEVRLIQVLNNASKCASKCASQVVLCRDLMRGGVVIVLLCNGRAIMYRMTEGCSNDSETIVVEGVKSMTATNQRIVLLLRDANVISLYAGMYHLCDMSQAALPLARIEEADSATDENVMADIHVKLVLKNNDIMRAKVELMVQDKDMVGFVMEAMHAILSEDHRGCMLFKRILNGALTRKKKQQQQQRQQDQDSRQGQPQSDWHFLAKSILETVRHSNDQIIPVLALNFHLLHQSMRLSTTMTLYEEHMLNELLIPLMKQLGWTQYLEYYERFDSASNSIEMGTKLPAAWPNTNVILHSNANIVTNPPDIFSWMHQRILGSETRIIFPILDVNTCQCEDLVFNRLRLICRLIHLLSESAAEELYIEKDMHPLCENDFEPHVRLVIALVQELSTRNSYRGKRRHLSQTLEWLLDDLPISISIIIRDCITQCRIGTPTMDHMLTTLGGQWQQIIIAFYNLVGRQDLLHHNLATNATQTPMDISPSNVSTDWYSHDKFVEVHEELFHETVIRPVLKQRQQPQVRLPNVLNQQSSQPKKKKEPEEPQLSSEHLDRYKKLWSTQIFHLDRRMDEVWSLLQTSRPQKMKKSLASLLELDDPQNLGAMEDTNSVEHHQLLQHLSLQVLSLPIGRGMLTLSTKNASLSTMTMDRTREQNTEMDNLTIPPLALAARVEKTPGKYVIIDASKVFEPYDPSLVNEQHIQTMNWSEFHNSVASALTLSPNLTSDQSRITREWILYHYRDGASPSEHKPTYTQAGILLSMGLQGHLKQLSRSDVYSLLKAMHDPTSIAILLGMSCSLIGTEDAQFTRTLSFHIPSLVIGMEMAINSEVQTAALVGMGLLYCGSRNRFMTEVLLNELAIPQDDHSINSYSSTGAGNTRGGVTAGVQNNSCTPAIHFMFYNGVNMTGVNITNFSTNRARDAYSLSAGFGIGLINLGCGGHASNRWIDERLVRYMEGGKRPLSDPIMIGRHQSTLDGNLGIDGDDAAYSSFDRRNHFYRFLSNTTETNFTPNTEKSKLGNGIGSNSCLTLESEELVNAEITGPGACIALSLLYLKSNKKSIAVRLKVPQKKYLADTVSPLMFTLRTMAEALVMWDTIAATTSWIESHVPDFIHTNFKAKSHGRSAGSEQALETLAEMYFHIITGSCLAIGLRYAGSHSKLAYTLCESIFRQIHSGSFANAHTPYVRQLSKGRKLLSKYALDSCAMTVLFAMCCIMSGSGNLTLMRIIRRWQLQQQNMFQQQRQRSLQQGMGVDGEQGSTGVFNNTYSLQMGLSMCMGLLFLGGGTITLSTSNLSVASLLMALYPRLPQHPLDNTYHHQMLRHLYVLACTDRDHSESGQECKIGGKLLQTVDLESRTMSHVPVSITLTHKDEEGRAIEEVLHKTSPCLLPTDSSMVSRIEIGLISHSEEHSLSSCDYYPQFFDSMDNLARMARKNDNDSRIVVEVVLKKKKNTDVSELMAATALNKNHNFANGGSNRTTQDVLSMFVQEGRCKTDEKLGTAEMLHLQPQISMRDQALFQPRHGIDIKLITASHERLLASIHDAERKEREWGLSLKPQSARNMRLSTEKQLLRETNRLVSVLKRYYFPDSVRSLIPLTDLQREQDERDMRKCRNVLEYFDMPTRSQLNESMFILNTALEGGSYHSSTTRIEKYIAALVLLFPKVNNARALELMAMAITQYRQEQERSK